MKEWMIEKLDAQSLFTLTSIIIIFGADAQAEIDSLYGSKPVAGTLHSTG